MRILALYLFLIFNIFTQAQNSIQERAILFYNTENLFDTKNDSLTNDDDFTPNGNYHWTNRRYHKKLTNLAKVFYDCNNWNTPFLIGLCEVENDVVLNNLLWSGSLFQRGYRAIHFEGPDSRGIDVALLYNSRQFTPIKSKAIREPSGKLITRDILYVQGIVDSIDTLNVFVCHFPSRRGGAVESEDKRIKMAKLLYNSIDSIIQTNSDAQIIAMGDFNDTPTDRAIEEIILKPLSNNESLICLGKKLAQEGKGSHKYLEEWSLIDQMFISPNFGNSIQSYSFQIVELPYLLCNDETNLGQKPLRTYLGPRYIGGYSDHLPIILRYNIKKAP